jgi:predicted Zn-dependent peptidase
MVFKGAGTRSSRDIVEVIESQGGSINAATGYERTSFQVRALKGGLDLGMDVIADLVLRPTLDEADLTREKQVVAQEIAEAADAPDDYVFDLIQPPPGATTRGPADPGHGRLGQRRHRRGPVRMARRALRARPPDDQRHGRGRGGRAAGRRRARLWRRARRAGAPAPPPPASSAAHEPRSASWSSRTWCSCCRPCGAREQDYFALRIFAECLGGGMSSRLFQEAREKRGLAYNIDAYSDTYADAGALGIYAGCAAGDAVETAKVCAEQLIALAAGSRTPSWPAPRPS